MIFKRIVKNWRESKRSDLRRSIQPYFKSDSAHYSEYRSGSEAYLRIDHMGTILEFWLELGQLGIGINGIDARESPALPTDVKKELKTILASKELSVSEKNNRVARLISNAII